MTHEIDKCKPYFKWQVAEMYNVDVKTLNAWLKPFEDRIGEPTKRKKYTPKQVEMIFYCIGTP